MPKGKKNPPLHIKAGDFLSAGDKRAEPCYFATFMEIVFTTMSTTGRVGTAVRP